MIAKPFVTLLLLLCATATLTAKRPNIIFVLADDLGWGDLASYGHPQVKTPHLDRLAREGTRFTQFYVASPVCSPSRAAFLTGEFPGRDGIHGHFGSLAENTARAMPQFLDPTRPTLVSDLKRAGYATAHIGKWHLRNNVAAVLGREPPDDRGQGPTPEAYGFDWVGSGEPFGGAGPPDDPYYRARSSRVFVDEAVGFIERHCDQPFYVQLWMLLPHARLNPRPDQLRVYEHLRPGRDFPHHSAAEIYLASVTDLDEQIGRLMAALDRLGLTEDTIVVFTSDNGPEDIHVLNAGHSGVGSTGPFRGRKRSLYEGGIRVPLIVRWPGRVPADRVDDTSVLGAVDWRPTFNAAAGLVPLPGRGQDGENVADMLCGAPRARKKPLLWEWRFTIPGEAVHRSPRLAVRDGDWKLLLNPDRSRVELYSLRDDPTELNNLASEHPDVVGRLATLATTWGASLPASPATPDAMSLPSSWLGLKSAAVPDP
ncbi:MAG: sulfatase-like hydrolase/transferase [Opitutaceae bacterium]|nr:sulfatase-like hydrolase/transferase [Opitutaceae bacterium]